MSKSAVAVAVIGCGYWGKNLVRNFAELGALAAVSDSFEDVARSEGLKYGVPALSLDAILADKSIQGLVIAAPAALHAQIGVRALEAGKAVFIEKPLALDIADGERLKSTAERVGRPLMVGHLLRYHPAFRRLLEIVQSGELGRVLYITSDRLSMGKVRIEEDVLWSFAPHDLAMILSLLGERPASVQLSGGDFLTAGIADVAHLALKFPSGVHASVMASWLHPFKRHQFTVVCEKGALVFEDSAPIGEKLRLYPHSIDRSGPTPIPSKGELQFVDFALDEPLKQECRHFLDLLSGAEKTPLTDAAEGLAVLDVLERARASISHS